MLDLQVRQEANKQFIKLIIPLGGQIVLWFVQKLLADRLKIKTGIFAPIDLKHIHYLYTY